MAISGSVNNVQTSSSGNILSSLATPDNVAGMRMAVPVISSVQGLSAVKDAYAASNAARAAYSSMDAAGAGVGGAMSSVTSGVGGVISNALHSLPGLLKSNFAISGLMSLFTNAIDFVQGKENGTQFLVDSACDTAAYTGIGATATMIGGMVGSVIPGFGTIIGMGVGALVGFLGGKLYETYLRPSFTNAVQAKFVGMSNGSQPSALPTTTTNSGAMPSAPVTAPAV